MSHHTPPDPHAVREAAVAASAGRLEPAERTTRPGARFHRPDIQALARKLRHQDGLSVTAIAATLGCSASTAYVLINGRRHPRRRYPPLLADVVHRYENGAETVTSIAASLQCHDHTAVRLLLEAGAQLRPDDDPPRLTKNIVDRYTRHRQSIRDIAAAIGRSYCYVRNRLIDANVPLRTRGGNYPPHPRHDPPPAGRQDRRPHR